MSFLNPLSFLFLFVVPILVLLYFLKLKRPNIKVPSTLLWQKVIEDMRVNSPFQKLKRSLLMLLQILILLAVIAALARPIVKMRDSADESIIVILDNSASMSALEEGKNTRLDIAKAEMLKLADHLSSGDEMMLITFNSRANVVSGFSNNKRKLRESISGIKSTECASSVQSALLLARSICSTRSKPRVILFSDGKLDSKGEVEMPVKIEYRPIGSTQPNLAVTGLDIRRSLKDRNRIEMFIAVENFSDKDFGGNMVVRLDDDIIDTKYFTVGARETLSQIFEAVRPSGGNIQVEFDVEDALECDNRAWKVVPEPTVRRILLVGESMFFLERVLKASSTVTFASTDKITDPAKELKGYSTVIWNKVAAPEVAPCNNVYIGCFPPIEGLEKGEEINAPDIMDWDNTHPINRFLDFNNLVISSTHAMALPEEASVILNSSQTPLVVVMESDHGVVCVTGFDPLKSNWPLLVSYPLFLNNCLNYFEEHRAKSFKANILAGDVITAPESVAAPVVDMPGGSRKVMSRSSDGGYSLTDVNKCGVYDVRVVDGDDFSVAVNLFNREESMLDTVESPEIGKIKLEAVNADKQINKEFWKHLVIALTALLLLEWFVYHRRIFV